MIPMSKVYTKLILCSTYNVNSAPVTNSQESPYPNGDSITDWQIELEILPLGLTSLAF